MTLKTDPKDAARPDGAVKRWKGLLWTLQPEYVKSRKLMTYALERHVESAAKADENENDEFTAQNWLTDLFDEETYEKLFAARRMGNFVIVRSTGKRDFEDMPIYARIGMHLLFQGSAQIRFLQWGLIRSALRKQSIRQGEIYDQAGPDAVKRVTDFIKTYSIDMREALISEPTGYKTFNEFFARKLKPDARPPAAPEDPAVIVSAADCRLTVFRDVRSAKQFWIKGKLFTIPALLGDAKLATEFALVPSIAIFRLAPQDYHRYHSPVSGKIRSVATHSGEYYTVNPMAVNQNLDVLTANRRDVLVIDATFGTGDAKKTHPVAFVAIGALLVGSVNWSKKVGDEVKKGDDLGWFAYGGSTVACVFSEGAKVEWDDDLVRASEGVWQGEDDPEVLASIPKDVVIAQQHKEGAVFGTEVLVRAGERIGASRA